MIRRTLAIAFIGGLLLASATFPAHAEGGGYTLRVFCVQNESTDFVGVGLATIGDETLSFTCSKENPVVVLAARPDANATLPHNGLIWSVVISFNEGQGSVGLGLTPGTCAGGSFNDNALIVVAESPANSCARRTYGDLIPAELF